MPKTRVKPKPKSKTRLAADTLKKTEMWLSVIEQPCMVCRKIRKPTLNIDSVGVIMNICKPCLAAALEKFSNESS